MIPKAFKLGLKEIDKIYHQNGWDQSKTTDF